MSPFICANPNCNKTYRTSKSLSMHLSQQAFCRAAYGASANPAGVVTTTVMDVVIDERGEMHIQKVKAVDTNLDTTYQTLASAMQHAEDEESFYDNHVDDLSEDDSVMNETNTVNQVLLDPAVTLAADKPPAVFTAARQHEVKLLKILNDVGAPLYAFETIMQWAFNARVAGYDFDPQVKHYATQMVNLQKMTNLGSIRPRVEMVKLAVDNLEIPVVCCPFVSMMLSLLNDPELNQLENLVINQSDPFGKYVPPDGRLGEVNSGAMYQLAYETMCKDPSKDFLIEVIMTMDLSVVSANSNLDSHPMMFTLAIFNSAVSK